MSRSRVRDREGADSFNEVQEKSRWKSAVQVEGGINALLADPLGGWALLLLVYCTVLGWGTSGVLGEFGVFKGCGRLLPSAAGFVLFCCVCGIFCGVAFGRIVWVVRSSKPVAWSVWSSVYAVVRPFLLSVCWVLPCFF